MTLLRTTLLLGMLAIVRCLAWQAEPPAELHISLSEALARARQYGSLIQSAEINARLAHEDRKQARAASLPTVNGFNQFIYTQGNGTPSGVFVANDGVHVYNEQLQAHEELFALLRGGEIRVAAAAEALARAKADVAARGLYSTVVTDYYAVLSAQKHFDTGQLAISEAQRFLDITQKQEQRGEAAHADVVKAQLQVAQRQRDAQDTQLALQKSKLALAVLIFPKLQIGFSVVDDANDLTPPPSDSDVMAHASTTNADVRAARFGVEQAHAGVAVARYGYLPSLALDLFYGINANQFAARTDYPTPESGRSTLPNYLVPYRQNLGYSAQATLNVPLWSWGSIHSKVKQAQLREEQARLDLTTAQKQLAADSASAEAEAQTAFMQVGSLRTSTELASESLRLTLLRYQAGEATALEVADAQTTANGARLAYDDGLVRYRIAVAALKNLTGTLQ